MAQKKMPDSYNSTPIVAPTNSMKQRMFFGVFAAILLFAGYIVATLYDVAVTQSEYYRSKANNQQIKSFTINANRGTIYDRNGKILAQSTTVWDVILNPTQIREYDAVDKEGNADPSKINLIARELARILELDEAELLDRIMNSNTQYYIAKKKIDRETQDKVEAFILENKINYYSVMLVENSKRYYPNDNLASSVIGFTNYDNDGVYGLEAYYDDYLKGVDGLVEMALDRSGGAMPYNYEKRYEASDGNSLILTIDEVVQHYLEKNLETTLSQHKVANRATGIIMNAKTGAIIAMATASGYDLNNPSELSEYDKQRLIELEEQLVLDYAAGSMTDQDAINELIQAELEATEAEMRETQWKNKAISELYFPGSVFKVITCASALEEEVINLNSTFNCYYEVTVADTKFHCWSPIGHGTVDLQSAITASCNPAFIDIGLKLGKQLFCNYFEAFGFTEKTGIDLPGEASPLYMPYERMGTVELASSSFGQTNKITPIQMICAYAAAINGGYLVTPHVVDKIMDSDGNVIKTVDTTVKRQVISEETSELMRQITENIVTTNGGTNAYIPGFRIGGKSGTSQKLDEYGEHSMRYVGSFCAFAPANDPEYIMLVCIDEPLGGSYYGSAVAAPVVSAVFSECLEYLNVYPQYTAEELAQQNILVPYVYDFAILDAISKLNESGLKYEIVGDESVGIVDYTMPLAASNIPRDGTVVIYMQGAEKQMVKVPDVTGLTVEAANLRLVNAGLNISLEGGAVNNASATASYQSIEAGEEVPRGTVVSVTFLVSGDVG
ncbi:MAG: PASTA domain-containing protein [Ruminiclostridium sp.]|nr:PASTA domain-containing protein [Ruminiclostridium sp.]